MSFVQSFDAIVEFGCTRLILGSMPGKASLDAHRYYAHPRNAFWPIMGALFDMAPALTYEERCQVLTGNGIALWDVMKSCERPGSLDSAIVAASVEANDFAALYQRYSSIEAIYFNGAAAERAYIRHVIPAMAPAWASLPRWRLPSTSPAHAALTTEDKLALWGRVAIALEQRG